VPSVVPVLILLEPELRIPVIELAVVKSGAVDIAVDTSAGALDVK